MSSAFTARHLSSPVRAVLVVIDVTPMLPGGGNGGAKWFVLALLGELVRQRPDWRWLLLTTAANDGFLGELFPAMDRLMVIDGAGRPILYPDPRRLPDGRRADMVYCPFTAPFHVSPMVPTVATVYDLQFAAYPQFFSRAEVEERASHFFRAARVAERLVCISDYVRDHVRRVTGLPAKRVCRVYISLPDRLAGAGQADAAAVSTLMARLGLVAGRYLIYPANTWPHKNHTMLLTAAGVYFARHPDSDLKLVCTGVSDDERGRMLRLAAERMGLAGRVRFPGFQSEGDLAALLDNARALLFPSLFEGFGMPVLEAMAQGMPVLSADTTCLPEIAGDAALLFDPRRPGEIVRAIETIETDRELAGRLAAAGRRRARALGDAASIGAQYLAVFDEVLAEERGFVGVIRRCLRKLRLVIKDGRYVIPAIRRRLRRLPGWLFGRVQLLRMSLSRRLPFLRALMRRWRGDPS